MPTLISKLGESDPDALALVASYSHLLQTQVRTGRRQLAARSSWRKLGAPALPFLP